MRIGIRLLSDLSQGKPLLVDMRLMHPSRILAKQNGNPRFAGNACIQHPDSLGLRYTANNTCVVCALETVKKFQKQNKDLIKQRTKNYYHANKAECLLRTKNWLDKNKEYRAEQKREYAQKESESIKAKYKQYYEANYPRMLAKRNKQHATKLQRTPLWLTSDDHWMIEQAYELASLRTKLFGFQWHVDHVIPLRGKLASGFHTPYNLQVIPAVDNLRKSNRMEIA